MKNRLSPSIPKRKDSVSPSSSRVTSSTRSSAAAEASSALRITLAAVTRCRRRASVSRKA